MNARKILIASICILMIAVGYIRIKSYANSLAEAKLQEAFAAIEFYADISYKKVNVNLFGLNAHINEVIVSPHGSKENIFIDEIVIYEIDNKNQIPTFAHIKLNGLISGTSNEEKNLSKNLGYAGNIKVNIELDYVYRKNERALYCDRFSYGADKIGTINLKYHISNLDLDFDNIIFLDSPFPNLLIHNVEMSFQNESFVERFMQMKAKEEGKEDAIFMQEIVEMIEEEISRTNDAFYQETLHVLKEFIKDPDKIVVEFAPDTPISLDSILEIDNLSEAIKLLNVIVKT